MNNKQGDMNIVFGGIVIGLFLVLIVGGVIYIGIDLSKDANESIGFWKNTTCEKRVSMYGFTYCYEDGEYVRYIVNSNQTHRYIEMIPVRECSIKEER